jgi:hypothetical protein
MTTDDDWLNFHYAVMEIKAKLGLSIGKAQSILRQLCGSGEVRSQKQPYITAVRWELQEEGPPERIEPGEWRSREIDLMTDDLGCRYLVDVSKSDLEYWLHQQRGKPELGKQALVMKYLAEKFPGQQRVPDPAHCQRKDLLAELRKRDPVLRQLDIKTLGRAIDKYNRLLGVDGKQS